ncbi:MAG: hypothetical protein AAFV88_15120 [Planctomycetota bacterium]
MFAIAVVALLVSSVFGLFDWSLSSDGLAFVRFSFYGSVAIQLAACYAAIVTFKTWVAFERGRANVQTGSQNERSINADDLIQMNATAVAEMKTMRDALQEAVEKINSMKESQGGFVSPHGTMVTGVSAAGSPVTFRGHKKIKKSARTIQILGQNLKGVIQNSPGEQKASSDPIEFNIEMPDGTMIPVRASKQSKDFDLR